MNTLEIQNKISKFVAQREEKQGKRFYEYNAERQRLYRSKRRSKLEQIRQEGERELVLKTYYRLKDINKTAGYLGISREVVRSVLGVSSPQSNSASS